VHCPTCDLDYDQDQNAVLNMLREPSGADPNPEQRSQQHFQAKPTTHNISTPAKRAA
jgi:transposase